MTSITIKKVVYVTFGLLLITAGVLLSYFGFKLIYKSQISQSQLYWVIGVAEVIALTASWYNRESKANGKNSFLHTMIMAYSGYVIAYVIALLYKTQSYAVIDGFVWLPVIAMFIISILFPLTALTWYGCKIMAMDESL